MKIKILKGQPDLHNRLIREIQDKSLERSRKDSTIRFDDRGNLINNEGMSDNILCFNSKLMLFFSQPLRILSNYSVCCCHNLVVI